MSDDPREPDGPSGVSRRSFLRGLGTTAAAIGVVGCQKAAPPPTRDQTPAAVEPAPPPAPAGADTAAGVVAVTLTVNGAKHPLRLEPRTTLIDALRELLGLTGPKHVCGEGACGACTVIYGGLPVYACLRLAVDAQEAEIRTVEGFAPNADDGRLHPVQEAFVEHDAVQCGFCTSGFVTSVVHLIEDNPTPTARHVKEACAGHLCRCGTYPRIVEAALDAAGVRKGG